MLYKKTLLLGMVHSPTKVDPSRGQEFRDRVRCESLEQSGVVVYTLDDKHDDQCLPLHCQTNFANARRMLRAVRKRWGPDIKFESIHLDYFFSPSGWAQTRWGDAFFRESLPAFSQILTPTGSVWLPHNRVVQDGIEMYAEEIERYFTCDRVENPIESILYHATERVEHDLLRCPDAITNATQLSPSALRPYAFLVLRVWS